jgi:myo-inositol-1(or 4)-monophosphatase
MSLTANCQDERNTMKLSGPQITTLLQTATQAARLAGKKAIDQLYNVSRIMKTPSELVTEADPLCQEIIINHIRKSFPGHGILAEEGPNGAMLVEPPSDSSDTWWIIDPIDGTNNYAHGLLCFCVSIGVFHNGRPVVGVIYDPNTDSMFTAAQDIQTCCNNRPIHAGQDPISQFAGFAVDSHFDAAVESAVHQIMRITRFRSVGSTALHMAYVAKGAMIGALTISAKLWDIAAGVLLIEQAGGIVTALDGKGIFPIDLHHYSSQRFRLLSANPRTHCELLAFFTTASAKSV